MIITNGAGPFQTFSRVRCKTFCDEHELIFNLPTNHRVQPYDIRQQQMTTTTTTNDYHYYYDYYYNNYKQQ